MFSRFIHDDTAFHETHVFWRTTLDVQMTVSLVFNTVTEVANQGTAMMGDVGDDERKEGDQRTVNVYHDVRISRMIYKK